jgi:hypothetical protein
VVIVTQRWSPKGNGRSSGQSQQPTQDDPGPVRCEIQICAFGAGPYGDSALVRGHMARRGR